MKRKLVILMVAAGMVLLFAAPALAIGPATVRGTLTENATVVKVITGAVVTVAGMPATVSGQGYEVAGVPMGPQPVVVTAPGHNRFEQTVELVAGDNEVNVALNVKLKTMYTRYYEAYSHRHYRTAWRMMHPDVLDHLKVDGRRFTYERYASFISHWATKWLSSRYLRIEETHKVWRPKATSGLQATYPNVKCVEYFHRYLCGSIVVGERGNCHWLQESGRWYLIFDNPCLAM